MKRTNVTGSYLTFSAGVIAIVVALYYMWGWPGPLLFIGIILFTLGVNGVNAATKEKEEIELAKLFKGISDEKSA